jgi:hypothetical protein
LPRRCASWWLSGGGGVCWFVRLSSCCRSAAVAVPSSWCGAVSFFLAAFGCFLFFAGCHPPLPFLVLAGPRAGILATPARLFHAAPSSRGTSAMSLLAVFLPSVAVCRPHTVPLGVISF